MRSCAAFSSASLAFCKCRSFCSNERSSFITTPLFKGGDGAIVDIRGAARSGEATETETVSGDDQTRDVERLRNERVPFNSLPANSQTQRLSVHAIERVLDRGQTHTTAPE